MISPTFPVLFISHGGGPWPYVGGLRTQYVNTEKQLRRLAGRLPARPKAVVVISGHWETAGFHVSNAERPPMEYDYSGFPAHTYEIRYPAPGDPALAGHARDLLSKAGLDSALDSRQGFDHGVFVPLGLMFPEADVPIVMVSVKSDYDPAAHVAAGRALAPLRDEGVLIVGSGLNYHNMRGFGLDSSTRVAESFTQYLDEAVAGPDVRARETKLTRWAQAPDARAAHPREDHLMPLLVAAGAAGDDAGRVLFSEVVMKIPMTSYAFGTISGD